MFQIIIQFFNTLEGEFLIKVCICVLLGTLLGTERQFKGKDAGIRTYCYVILGSMIFTFLSLHVDPASSSRIAAQIVTGVGFLGAGLIIKDTTNSQIKNLTTAASIRYAGGLGMLVGFGYYIIAGIAVLMTFIVPLIARIISSTFDPRPKV